METRTPTHTLPPARIPLPPTRRRVPPLTLLGRAGTGLSYALVGLVVGLILALTVPIGFGYRTMSVLSGSMSPAIEAGDAVVVKGVSPLEARIGDVVTFPDPSRGGRLVTHRVRGIRIVGGQASFVTKGDANNATETWAVAVDGTIGRVAYAVPKAGYILVWGGSPLGRIALIAVPLMLIGALEVARIWRTPSQEVT